MKNSFALKIHVTVEENSVQKLQQNRLVSCGLLLSWNKHLSSLKWSLKFSIPFALSCVHIFVDSKKTSNIISSLLHVKFLLSKLGKNVSSWLRNVSSYCFGKQDIKTLADNVVSPGKKKKRKKGDKSSLNCYMMIVTVFQITLSSC